MRAALANVIAIACYPLAAIAARWGGRDPLQLGARDRRSHWIQSEVATDAESYFSDGSRAGTFATRLLVKAGRLFAPRRKPGSDSGGATGRRGEDTIPDEIYTLW